MAMINRKTIRPMKIAWKKMIDGDTSMHYYSSKAWQRLRNMYLSLHPVCEICVQYGHIEPATEVHHIRRFMSETNEAARWNTFLNENNLVSLCSKCHYGCHNHMRKHHTDECGMLTQEEWEQAQVQYGNLYGNYNYEEDE